MKRPWLKFYPTDWQADAALGMCSLAARGLWIELISVMHAAEPYGHLVRSSRPLTEAQIAVLARCAPKDVKKLLRELEDNEVLSRTSDGTIFSRRMIRDAEKANLDRENGGRGGNPRLKPKASRRDKEGVNPPDNQSDKANSQNGVKGEDKAHIPEARSQSPEDSTQKEKDLYVGDYTPSVESDEEESQQDWPWNERQEEDSPSWVDEDHWDERGVAA